MTGRHSPPSSCPVCGDRLVLTRLGCESCGTELSGSFEPCEFCNLAGDDRDLLRVFLASRGNMKELERHLGVSYPTARSRYDGLLERLDLAPDTADSDPQVDVLDALARGEIDIDEALNRLR